MYSGQRMDYEDLNMRESQQVLEWMAMGETRGEIKSLLGVLAVLFPPGAPPELEAAIRATTNPEQLQSWIQLAVKANSLEAFRQAAGL